MSNLHEKEKGGSGFSGYDSWGKEKEGEVTTREKLERDFDGTDK